MSVNGGTIYADWDPDENELEFDPDIGEEFEEFEEMGDEIREETGRSPGLCG